MMKGRGHADGAECEFAFLAVNFSSFIFIYVRGVVLPNAVRCRAILEVLNAFESLLLPLVLVLLHLLP